MEDQPPQAAADQAGELRFGRIERDSQARDAMYRICRLAGLPERGWHVLRHSFGTHAAMLGVNPWRLQTWMGHKRIDETMLYVNFAGAHMRPIPPEVHAAAGTELDPDKRILKMLGARGTVVAQPKGKKDEAEGLREVSWCALQDSKTCPAVRLSARLHVRVRIPSVLARRPARRARMRMTQAGAPVLGKAQTRNRLWRTCCKTLYRLGEPIPTPFSWPKH